MRKLSWIVAALTPVVLALMSAALMWAVARDSRLAAVSHLPGSQAGPYVVAFGMYMPLRRFLVEVAPLFLFQLWPLMLLASVLQVVFFRRGNCFADGRLWTSLRAIVAAPAVSYVVRVLLYLSGMPDATLLARSSFLSLHSLLAVAVGYWLPTFPVLGYRRAHGGHLGEA